MALLQFRDDLSKLKTRTLDSYYSNIFFLLEHPEHLSLKPKETIEQAIQRHKEYRERLKKEIDSRPKEQRVILGSGWE